MEETGAFVAATFIMKSGRQLLTHYTMMAVVLANFGPNSQTILPVWPMFPIRCSTDGFFHFSICCSRMVLRTKTNLLDQKDCYSILLLKKIRACNFHGY